MNEGRNHTFPAPLLAAMMRSPNLSVRFRTAVRPYGCVNHCLVVTVNDAVRVEGQRENPNKSLKSMVVHYSTLCTQATEKQRRLRARWEKRFQKGPNRQGPFRSNTFDNVYLSQDGAGYHRLREPTGVHRPGVDPLPGHDTDAAQ